MEPPGPQVAPPLLADIVESAVPDAEALARRRRGGSCEMNRKVLEKVNASAFMTHAVVEGKYVLRMAIGATLTEEGLVLGAWKVNEEMADGIVSEEDQ
ncbi:Tyrosine/DOPA decarboxylase 1 [Acorus calamus]|uniref:Tyrosine/DOPA decarboxylase 1 n=1 Tax=Acorus calamus TaxID=4465 RepID=A0AAV9FIR1_ACOCL|nr:Tyrosine/DOPA decarboxylase 1 [Acorus calamus]